MSQHRELFAALAAPFQPGEVTHRAGGAGTLSSVAAQAFMDRLDNVLGPENWSDELMVADRAIICRLSIRLPDGAVVTKCGATSRAPSPDCGSDDSSGDHDAFKRAAIKFGVGRHLEDAAKRGRGPEANSGSPRREPARAERPAAAADPTEPTAGAIRPWNPDDGIQAPRTGRALFAWTREQDKSHQFGLLDYLSEWAKERKYPGRMVDWDAAQVAEAYAEACVKLRGMRRVQGNAAPALAR